MSHKIVVNKVNEVFLEGDKLSITITNWSNLEGINIMVSNNDLSTRMVGSLTWDELDLLELAIANAKTV